MTPWRPKGARTYKGRIRGRDGIPRQITLRTRHEEDAISIQETLDWLTEKRRWSVLDLIMAKLLTAPEVHDAHVAGTLQDLVDATVARQAATERALATALRDPALLPLVDEWALGTPQRYPIQVRLFVKSLGENATLSQFRRREVSAFLTRLKKRGGKPATGSTKRRYRVALSQFARFLVERELLETNIVRDVKGASENKPRMLFHTRAEAKLIVNALDGAQQALEALMAGTSMEWGAAVRLRRQDIDQLARSVWAEGTKNEYRSRRVFFTEDWAWDAFWAYAKDFTPNAPLFGDVDNEDSNEAHRKVCRMLKLKVTRLHDWRHTYAIYSLEDGIQPQAVKQNMGHAPNSTELERVYSAWMPKDREAYRKRFAATESATGLPDKAPKKPRAAG